MSKVYSREVKERTVWAATELLLRVGCEVSEIRDGDRITLDILIPPDSSDPHNARLQAAVNAQKSGTGYSDPA